MPSSAPWHHPPPPATGHPAVFQGRYGSRGNLELFVPAPRGGLTCCWFNSDPVEGPVTEPAIPPGTWSAGLALGEGRSYGAVTGLQASGGPDYLEVVAAGAHGLDRWTWSPEDAFTLTDTFWGVTGLPFLAEAGASLVLGAAQGGLLRRWTGAAPGYPRVADWQEDLLDLGDRVVAVTATPDGSVHALTKRGGRLRLHSWTTSGAHTSATTPVAATGAAALFAGSKPEVVTAADGELRRWVAGSTTATRLTVDTGGVPDAVSCAWSTMGRARHLEVVTRSGDALRHHRWPGPGPGR